MSTFLLMLRLAFWINPLQRALTCIGLVIVAAGSIRAVRLGLPGFALEAPFIALEIILLMGGVFWRIASAPRIVRLAPHGRSRLLGSIMAMVLLIAMFCVVQLWGLSLRWPGPRFHPSLATHLVVLVDFLMPTSAAIVGVFIASRSPLAALLVILGVACPVMAARLFDVKLQFGGVADNLTMLALIWIPFGIWYLTARRISFPRWLASGGQDVLAATLVSARSPNSRQEALQHQLLGGTTVLRLALQWFAVIGILLAVQWVVAMMGELSDPDLVARTMYASLCICPIVTVVISFAAIQRSRTLWLLTASNRGEFFLCVERILLRLNIAMVLVFACWLAVLWVAQSWRPDSAGDQLVLASFHFEALWVLGLLVIYAQFAGIPKWPVAILAAAALIFVWRLSASVGEPDGMAGTTAVLAAVVLLVTAATATIALRWQAQRRWCNGDFPRAAAAG